MGAMTMRRSKYVTILLAGAAATALAGCDQPPPTQDMTLYGDIAACERENTPDECAAAFATAKAEHIKQAPKFGSKQECEAAGFTQCEEAATGEGQAAPGQTAQGGGSGIFMPMMMGYMMGRMLGGGGMMGGGGVGQPQQRPMPGSTGPTDVRPSTGAASARPVYGDRNGYLYTGRGSAVGQVAPGTTSLGSRAVPMRTARGGFGSSARGFSGGS
jgi:uncharacterized protein YgiB involved in biofilm formation